MNRKRILSLLSSALLALTLWITPIFEVSAEEREGETTQNAQTTLAVPSINGALQVLDGHLSDETGAPVQLRGVSTHGLGWYPEYVNQECISEWKDWGANLLRLALYTAEDNGYCTGGDQEALKDLIRDGVSYATNADMYVLIDWHILSEGTPAAYQEEAESFFAEMSAEFAGQDNVLYEICNEPTTADWPEIKAYAEDIIPIIRANDPDAIIIVGTPSWSQEIDKPVEDPITDWDNVMYTLHFYAATHKDDLRNRMKAAADAGLPVFVTEFGICDASGSGELDLASADEWIELMNSCGISYAMWNLSNKEESSSILKPDVTKTSGFTYDDLSETGQWLYDLLGSALSGTALQEPSAEAAKETEQDGTAELFQTEDGLAVSIRQRTSWDDGYGTYSFLYDITLTNNSGAAISSWNISIAFNGDFTLTDTWNGTYTVKGTTIDISNVAYNGSLEDGASVSDVGFIIAGSSELRLL